MSPCHISLPPDTSEKKRRKKEKKGKINYNELITEKLKTAIK